MVLKFYIHGLVLMVIRYSGYSAIFVLAANILLQKLRSDSSLSTLSPSAALLLPRKKQLLAEYPNA
jgi:hypothetical protein